MNLCQAELDYDDDSDVNGASAKLPKKIVAAEVSRGYMGEGATIAGTHTICIQLFGRAD